MTAATKVRPSPKATTSPLSLLEKIQSIRAQARALRVELATIPRPTWPAVPPSAMKPLTAAAEQVTTRNRELLETTRDLEQARVRCAELARSGAALRAANEQVKGLELAYEMAQQRLAAAVEQQQTAASAAIDAAEDQQEDISQLASRVADELALPAQRVNVAGDLPVERTVGILIGDLILFTGQLGEMYANWVEPRGRAEHIRAAVQAAQVKPVDPDAKPPEPAGHLFEIRTGLMH